jgi:uncharacterized repeat protein (TIGR03803 family)
MGFSERFLAVCSVVLGICCASIAAGCSHQGLAPAVIPQAPAVGPGPTIVHRIGADSSSYQVLYAFGSSGANGLIPESSLINVKGTLWGTTALGGAYGNGTASGGTVFSISATGTEQVLHSFGAGSDGSKPFGGLIDVRGTLYGTTLAGGTYNKGTVFSISTTGTEQVRHSFAGGSDGSNPYAGLLNVNGTLYGTTANGGTYGGGTVFSISSRGKEHVLYSFGRNPYGAIGPGGNLIDVNGTLYGTAGGGTGNYCTGGCGTVFSISTSGKEHVLYNFGGPPDGEFPGYGLVDVNGVLFGTTNSGGTHRCFTYFPGYCGTIFSVTTGGTEHVIYSFGSSLNDGSYPQASLIDVKGTLYGTTEHGGAYWHGTGYSPGGTVFRIKPNGKREHVLHSFGSGTDGVSPSTALIDVNGKLYGTTPEGGGMLAPCSGFGVVGGCGTVFALSL